MVSNKLELDHEAASLCLFMGMKENFVSSLNLVLVKCA